MVRCKFSAICGILRSISIVAYATIAGCGSSFNWIGTWSGERRIQAQPGSDKSVARTLAKVTLTIEPGGIFTLVEAGMPKQGRIRTRGVNATLTTERIAGRSIGSMGDGVQNANKPIELTAATDGTISLHDPGGFFSEPVTLRRVAQRD